MEGMTPAQTVTFVCSLIMCAIGIATFISALLTRARKDGQLEYKVDAALQGIDEIKNTLNRTHSWQEESGLKIQSHEEKIKTLFTQCENFDKRLSALEKKGNSNV